MCGLAKCKTARRGQGRGQAVASSNGNYGRFVQLVASWVHGTLEAAFQGTRFLAGNAHHLLVVPAGNRALRERGTWLRMSPQVATCA